jgi:uncharacterized protein Yka (UPF0111/DUF47 family)
MADFTEHTATIDTILDNMEALADRIEMPKIVLSDEQQQRFNQIAIVRYAVQSGVPVQAALHLAGFSETAELLRGAAVRQAEADESIAADLRELMALARRAYAMDST